jgi:tRNA (mo5U34)-methyltransferase
VTAPLQGEALRKRVDELLWHHQIDLGNGIVTPGKDPSDAKFAQLKLPSLEGKTVLDIGAWNGYFSFAAERLGASRVVALDSFAWGGPAGASWGSQESFNLAREVLGSKVEDVYCEVLDISPERIGRFDVVLFLGVLYHMRDPFLSLEKAASVCDELLVVESLADMLYTRRPAAAFYPGASMNNDVTNWWGPNPAAVVEMLKDLGFKRIEVVNAPSIPQRLRRIASRVRSVVRSRLSKVEPNLTWRFALTDRVMIHAYRN